MPLKEIAMYYPAREAKKTWMRGPWDQEADKIEFRHPETGYPCLIVRNSGGALCGYVGVPESHPLYKKDYSECVYGEKCPEREGDDDYRWCGHTPESRLRVHGGITFASACTPNAKEDQDICHVPLPGESDHVWWFGFDCAHSGDYMPAYTSPKYQALHDLMETRRAEKYKDVEYVKSEIEQLAFQLKGIEAGL